ncbi:MAG: flagellar basal-body rod protein FlgG [Anaerocolumna sp.]
MMRSLWTAASGMISQQTSVDTISNNLANINTTGYKKETAQFKTLLYQTIQDSTTDNAGQLKPVGAQVGLGVRNSAIISQYTQGTLKETGNSFDFAIAGNGFFMVQLADGSTGYTRNGSFGLSIGSDGITLATSEGYPVLDNTGQPIVLPNEFDTSKIEVDDHGNLMYTLEDGTVESLDIKVGLAQFSNPAGLEKTSNSILKETQASGTARIEGEDANISDSLIKKGYLEASNVQAANEMVDLIVSQRAYEMSSKAINASDEMLQQANNLRR